jgi:ribonuclease R
MQERVLKLLGRRDYAPADAPQLLKALQLPPGQAQRLRRELEELERRGEVARIKGNRYVIPREADLVPGRIQITRQGRGFLLPDDPGLGEIAIRSADTGTAMHDDRVLVRRDVRPLGMRSKDDPAHTGVVVRVLERRRTQIVGTLKRDRQFLRVVPDDPRMAHDILVPPARDVGRTARDGDKVVVALGKWDSPQASPQGTITEVLGPPTAEGVDMLSVLRQYDLPLKFPRKVLQEVRHFGAEVTPRDLRGRKDCRKAPVVTIDPADAKDFDDAFSLEGSDQKRWRLCVHIADVSHYVKPGSALDDEARKRGNSTYLVDRVIPMLPEALSNELCSLKPDVERLTKCVEFLIADDGSVQRTR